MSRRPYALIAASTRLRGAVAAEMSHATAVTSAPDARSSAAARSSSVWSLAQITRRARRRASSIASSRPRPREAPVTIATSPVMLSAMLPRSVGSAAATRLPLVTRRYPASPGGNSHAWP
jgi:hypothetical protein